MPDTIVAVDPGAPGGDRTVVHLDGVAIHLEPVVSSNLAAIGHHETVGLIVAFKGGAVWRYDEVTASAHADLMAASSVGSHFARHVKGKYTETKLEG